jgi:hypothetical protein
LFDFLIWLCAVIAFAVYNGSGWGRDMMKATFSFALIMWVFGLGERTGDEVGGVQRGGLRVMT